MKSPAEANNCAPCGRKRQQRFSWMPAILVAILPKCPFCVMAYSGAISMCSGNNLYPNAGGIMSYVTIGLGLLILVSLLFNYKNGRTWIAVLITIVGIGLLMISQFQTISSELYYLGTLLLFFGIWYNASFAHFYRKLTARFQSSFNKNLF